MSDPRAPLPPKLYFRIGEVATLVGVEPHVLRYWEREFRTIRPSKSAKGQRVYSRRDVENLMRVRDLLYGEGFTIAGARKKLQRQGPPVRPEPTHAGDPAEAIEPAAAPRLALPTTAREDRPPEPRAPLAAGGRSEIELRERLIEVRDELQALLHELGGS